MSLKTKTEQMLDNKDIEKDDPERIELLEAFDNAQHPYENLETAYQQEKYFHQSGHFIKPWEVPFATAFYPCHNPVTNHVDQVARHVTFQYIPLKDLLKHILENKGFMRAIQQYQPSRDGIMRDFHDGEFCLGHVFFSNGRNVALLLYVDDCEIANPLGSKAGIHKIGVIYCTILNLPPKFRSSLCNCYLVALYNTGDVKTYGFEPILAALVTDIKELESRGLHIITDVFEGDVHVGIAQIHLVEMHRALTANSDMLWDHDNYTEDLDLNDPSSTGIKAPCLLNDLEHFHVTTNYAPDVMHDLLEGVAGLEVHLVVADLVQSGFFDLDLLNSRITSFDYAPCD
ncbi:Hypothetical predicted protein [Paramuricea clavata]|uniref:Uncharacterized protein n=1 Tax=Paramuricea clavata TaxID=317549 RepID=A0A7D9D9Z8_PARCT|nr:Hypothetical predicted protein [Paramuricea clavata]